MRFCFGGKEERRLFKHGVQIKNETLIKDSMMTKLDSSLSQNLLNTNDTYVDYQEKIVGTNRLN